MSFKMFLGTAPRQLHEIRSTQTLIELLRQKYATSKDFCHLLLQYQCEGREIDATVIKANAIINLELKAYTPSEVVCDSQGFLRLEPGTSRERMLHSSTESMLSIVRDQNNNLNNKIRMLSKEILRAVGLQDADRIPMRGYVVFDLIERFDSSQIPGQVRPWFQVTDLARIVDEVGHYEGQDRKRNALSLTEAFALEVSKALGLRAIENIDDLVAKPTDMLIPFRPYLEKMAKEWRTKDYVSRPSLEHSLISLRKCTIVGRPGAGKTTLLQQVCRYEAMKSTVTRLPVFLNLSGPEEIKETIAGEVGLTDNEYLDELLEKGQFIICFDGLDEMVRFKEHGSKIQTFVRRYAANQFILSVRREFYDSEEHSAFFRRLGDFETIRIPEFTREECDVYIRYSEGENSDDQLRAFGKSLPDSTPLTLKMAIEISKESKNPVYENTGKFFQQYFRLRLKREVAQSRDLQRGADLIAYTMLRELGGKLLESHAATISVEELIKAAKGLGADNPLALYNMLLRAEILTNGLISKRINNQPKTENDVWFYHHTYREFFVAEHLLTYSEANMYELTEKWSESNALVMYCGIETRPERIHSVIEQAQNFNSLVECYCNAGVVDPSTTKSVTEAISDLASRNEDGVAAVLSYVRRYGGRICGIELLRTLDVLAKNSPVHEIEWELIKSERLGLGDFPVDLIDTPCYRYQKAQGARLPFLEVQASCLYSLAKKMDAQNKKGFDFYVYLQACSSPEQFLQVLCDHRFAADLRETIVEDLVTLCRDGKLMQRDIRRAVANNVESFCETSLMCRWQMVPFFTYAIDSDEPSTTDHSTSMPIIEGGLAGGYSNNLSLSEVELLSNWFTREQEGLVQLRIAYGVSFLKEPDAVDLLCRILACCQNGEIFDIGRLTELRDEEYYEELDSFLGFDNTSSGVDALVGTDESEPIAGPFKLRDFRDESYEIVIKAIALEGLGKFKEHKAAGERLNLFALHPNDKLQAVANEILDAWKKDVTNG